jgi:hypothetical protein
MYFSETQTGLLMGHNPELIQEWALSGLTIIFSFLSVADVFVRMARSPTRGPNGTGLSS